MELMDDASKKKFRKWFARNCRYVFVILLVFSVSSFSFIKIADLYEKVNELEQIEKANHKTI